jgi:hypothetical protein
VSLAAVVAIEEGVHLTYIRKIRTEARVTRTTALAGLKWRSHKSIDTDRVRPTDLLID